MNFRDWIYFSCWRKPPAGLIWRVSVSFSICEFWSFRRCFSASLSWWSWRCGWDAWFWNPWLFSTVSILMQANENIPLFCGGWAYDRWCGQGWVRSLPFWFCFSWCRWLIRFGSVVFEKVGGYRPILNRCHIFDYKNCLICLQEIEMNVAFSWSMNAFSAKNIESIYSDDLKWSEIEAWRRPQ